MAQLTGAQVPSLSDPFEPAEYSTIDPTSADDTSGAIWCWGTYVTATDRGTETVLLLMF